MAFDPFVGWSEADLSRALREAQEDLAYGKSLSSMGAGDTNAGYLRETQAAQRIEMLLRKLFALNPTTYPSTSFSRLDRTKASFSS